jgi:3-keto-5-aminohexanoate cleavage enzyme
MIACSSRRGTSVRERDEMQANKFILNFTPTGMIPTKEMTPNVPISVDEIVNDVFEAADLGVNMVHLHARDPVTGEPTYRKEIYAEIISRVREKNDQIILCVSTSGRLFNRFELRAECLELNDNCKPDFASLTLSSLNFNKETSVNTPQMIQDLAKKMLEKGIRPELEVFDMGMINYAKYLIGKDLLRPPHYFNIIVGNIACAQADLMSVGLMIRELPEESIWSVGGVGDFQVRANIMGLVSGGGVRVGLEDNIWYDSPRTKLATNIDMIKRVLAMADAINCKPYKATEVRHIFGLA